MYLELIQGGWSQINSWCISLRVYLNQVSVSVHNFSTWSVWRTRDVSCATHKRHTNRWRALILRRHARHHTIGPRLQGPWITTGLDLDLGGSWPLMAIRHTDGVHMLHLLTWLWCTLNQGPQMTRCLKSVCLDQIQPMGIVLATSTGWMVAWSGRGGSRMRRGDTQWRISKGFLTEPNILGGFEPGTIFGIEQHHGYSLNTFSDKPIIHRS